MIDGPYVEEPERLRMDINRTTVANKRLKIELCEARAALAQATTEIERLQNWVNDLQAGMYINCVYCGHRYGPDDEVPATMADVLKEHISKCPEHPMSKQTQRIEQLEKVVNAARTMGAHRQ